MSIYFYACQFTAQGNFTINAISNPLSDQIFEAEGNSCNYLCHQMVRNFRKPLVVMAPKLLLRHPSCVSRLSDMAPGTSFLPVLADTHVAAQGVSKVVFVSGKHYYVLEKYRLDMGITDTALIRVEVSKISLYASRG